MSPLPRFKNARSRHRKPKATGPTPRRRKLFLEALEDRRLLACDAVPTVSLSGLSDPFIGESTQFTATFDNTGSFPGFGPYIDLIIPATGTDGDDGLSYFVATHLGVQLTPVVLTFDASGQATHPYAVDSSDNPIVVSHPLGASGAGDQLVVLQLPFGSFTAAQTLAEVNITADLSNLADLGAPLTVYASGGFQYGCDEFDNPTPSDPGGPDPSILGAQTSGSVNPRVFEASKTYNGPEGDETATGPNYVQSYDLIVDIADGQPISNLVIEDLLPPNHVYVGVPSVTINGNPATLGTDYTLTDEPPTVSASPWTAPSSQNNLQVTFLSPPPITGTASGTDVVVTVEFYIAESREGTPPPVVIDPNTGDEVLEDNTVDAEGYWVPLDPRDPPSTVSDSATYEDLEERSIAIQKSVSVHTDVGQSGVSPGDILEWTLDFQVSDFFAFDNLFLTDVLSDGQEFFADDDPLNGPFVSAPTVTITENPLLPAQDSSGTYTFSLSATAPPFGVLGNYYVVTDSDGIPGPSPGVQTGETTIEFDLSKLLRDQTPPVDDQLVGGLFLDRDDNRGSTTGTITFFTRVLDQYREDFPSGDPSLNENDALDNDIDIEGDILAGDLTTILGQEDDQGAAGTAVPQGDFIKEIYAVNGVTTLPDPLVLVPGDEVTFRMRYDLFLGDYELFRVSDFLPLPIFRAADPDASDYPDYNDTVTYTTSDPLTGSPPSGVPLTGEWQRGPADTHTQYADYNGDSITGDVNVSVDFAANSVTWELGTYDDPTNSGGVIDLLFTVTATGDPFADGLFLTNQATKDQQDTFLNPVQATDIRQVQIGEPELRIQKGVIATDNTAGTFSPATVAPTTVTSPGSAGFRFGSDITSSGLATTPINSNLSGIDAGDLVTFAIVVENTGNGRRGAFDVQISDTLPAGFEIPSAGAGLNLQVTDGTGDAFLVIELGDGGGDDLFGAGIELQDPGPTPPTGSGTSLDTDAGAIDQYDATDGRNIAVITYDLIAVSPPDADAVQPRQTLTNTATLFNYASLEGGPDFTEDDLTDDADVTTRDPSMTKSLVGTSVVTPNNSNTEAVIGETIQYSVEITVPEGTINAARVLDTLDRGLRFVSLDSAVASSGAVTFGPVTATPSTAPNDGTTNAQTVTFELGTVENADTDNAVDETITLTYTVLVLNTADNQNLGLRNNRARFRWTVDGSTNTTPNRSASNVTIIEPVLQTVKSAVVAGSGTAGQYGDPVTYTIVISHAGSSNTDAYDVTFSDPLPTIYVDVSGFSATHSALGDISGRFEIAGPGTVLQTRPGQSFDLLQGQTVTITVDGTLSINVQPGLSFPNVATTRWTSLDGAEVGSGDVDGERNGSGGVNDYISNGGAFVSILPVDPGKTIVGTNQAHTQDQDVAIGEIVTYRITAIVPQGTTSSVTLVDTLDPGLAIVDLPTIGANVTIVAAPTINTSRGDFATVADTAVVGAGGGSLTLDFGDLTNTDTNPNAQDILVIEYKAVVLNTLDNNRGVPRNNLATFNWVAGGAPQSASDSAPDVTIVEPELQVTKSNGDPLLGDAGDTIEFTLVVEHTSSSNTTAMDVRLSDIINVTAPDNYMTYVPGSLSIVDAGGPVRDPANVGNEVLAGDLDIRWSQFPLGATSTVTFQVTLDTGTPVDTVLTNTADLYWTSLPGDESAAQTSNSFSGERTGDPADPGAGEAGANDHAATEDGIVITPVPTFDKQVVDTSEPMTGNGQHDPALPDLTIGETVTFALVATLPDGANTNVILADTLPTGLVYESATLTRSSTPGEVGSDLFSDSGFTIPITLPAPGISGNTLTFDFGTIYNVADADAIPAARDELVIQIVARADNVLTNQGEPNPSPPPLASTLLTNEGSLTYTPGTGIPVTQTDTEQVEIVEPDLSLSKELVPPSGLLTDPLTFIITIDHTAASTADAVDVVIDDVLPAGMTYAGNFQVLQGAGPTVSQVGQSLEFSWASFPLGDGPYQFSFDVLVDAQFGNPLINTAVATWRSLDPGSGERDGSDGPGLLNDYTTDDSAGLATVSGQKRDADTGLGLAGVTIYLDLNDNGAFDLNEPYDVTDANGNFIIAYLPGGVHVLRELVPDYYVPTLPASGAQTVDFTTQTTVTGVDFVNERVAPLILDDGDPGFSFVGDWIQSNCEYFYDSDARYICGTIGGENVAQWQFTGLEPGATYQVSATWVGGTGRSTDAPYTVTGGAVPVTTVMNQRLSPGVYPGSFQDQGASWADLTTAYTIFGDTLTVQLSDAHSGGCVIADAIRLIQVTTPEISVWDGGASLVEGVSQVDLGETDGTPLQREFTIRNEGGASLALGTITLPPGYSLVQGLGQATLLPGQSTTFVVQLDATAPGTFSGWITVGNNDNDEAPFSFGITGTVGSVYNPTVPPAGPPPAPPPVAAPDSVLLLDGSDVLYPAISVVDFGTTSEGQGVTRTFTILNPGTATASVTLGALDVPAGFTTDYVGAGTVLAPGGSLAFGLTLEAVSAGTFSGDVELSGSGGDLPFVFTILGEVVAGLPPLTAPIYIDNDDPGYTDTAGFYRKSGTGYLGDYELAKGDSTGDYARWSFANLPDGTFRVSASWFGKSSFTSHAPYQLTGIDGGPQTVAVNQQVPPDDFVDQGVSWENLGTFPISGGTLVVELTDSTTGYLTADAIRLEQLTLPEITVLDGAVELTSGSSLIDFGGTSLGTPVSRTLTVRNDGGGPLQLPASIVVPGGFSLTAPLGSTSLASGQSTTLTIQLDANASGTFSGPISFQNNDADESPFQFTIQGIVGLGIPALTEPIYIDNDDAGYTSTAGFYRKAGTGYLGDYVLGKGDNTGDYAQWEFAGLPGGTFRVAASYWTRSSWTDAAQYTVRWVDATGVTQNQAFSVNQRVAGDFYDQGAWWKQLGVAFEVQSGSTLTVRLTDEGGGYYVVGDAVRVEQLSPLLAEAPARGAAGAGLVSLDAVPAALVQQAAALWAAADPAAAARLAGVQVFVADLPGRTLGLASAWTDTIWLDVDAAGQGWYLEKDEGGRGKGEGDPISNFSLQTSDFRFDLLTVIGHELGHVLGLGHAEDEHGLMVDTLPAGVRRLELPGFDGHGELFRPGILSSRSAAGAESDLARALALNDWGSLSDGDLAEAGGLSAGRAMAGRGRADEAVEDAALLAWADDDEEDDAEVLIGLRRDDEDEHSERVDSVFEASDDWGLAPFAWQTEDRPHRAGKR